MQESTAYAQRVDADVTAKAFYVAAAKTLGRQPFRRAVSDYLRGNARVEVATALLSGATFLPSPPHQFEARVIPQPRDPTPPAAHDKAFGIAQTAVGAMIAPA